MDQLRNRARLVVRVLFFAAVLVVGYGVFGHGAEPHFIPWDKAQHFIAFYGLTFLGLYAFSRRSALRLGVLQQGRLAVGLP